MKNFLVFTYYVGRPLGGAKDFLDSFESVEEALESILKERQRYYQIVEASSFQTVREGLAMYKDFSPQYFQRESSDRDERQES